MTGWNLYGRFTHADAIPARMKEELYQDLAQGTVGIRKASRRMRKILGMSQKEYAQKVADISPRILCEFENGSGNPTLAALEKIAAPFGLRSPSCRLNHGGRIHK